MKSQPDREKKAGEEGSDLLIEEIRSIRRELSERFDNDVDRLIDHLRDIERQNAARVIRTRAPRGAPSES